ncbi:MAG: branched-chain amino acid ABC transporter permease [Acidiferrobacterales bacterium]
MDIFILQVLNSLFYASVLFLLAAGLSLIFGVMGIINMAHGSLFALGAYVTAWAVGSAVGSVNILFLFLLLPVGAIAVAVAGLIIEPTLLRPMYKRREEYQLLITFGLLLVLEDFMHVVWGGKPLTASELIDAVGIIHVGEYIYPTYNLLVIAIGVVAAISLWAFVYRTKFGVMLRATSQNMKMASALGLNVRRVYMQAFAIGCFMAGLGGAIVVPSQAAVLGMGLDFLILAFVVVVIGGLGSLEGALIGALIVSFVRTGVIQFYEEFELAVLYLIAAVVLLIRPTGLFGKPS